MDQAGELLGQHVFVAQAPFFHGTGLKILDQYIGGFEQAQQDGLARRLAHVQGDGAFVAVDADEVAGIALVEGRAPVTHFVALRGLDLDDLGAVVGQNHGAVRPAEDPREVHDLDACQCAGGASQTLAGGNRLQRTIHGGDVSLRMAVSA